MSFCLSVIMVDCIFGCNIHSMTVSYWHIPSSCVTCKTVVMVSVTEVFHFAIA